MRLSQIGREATGCPYIDREDARCGPTFSLSRINQAFHRCVNDHLDCPVYRQIHREEVRGRVTITIQGETVERFRRSLRPTGT